MRKSSSQTKRATAALTVTAAGGFLTPMIIFKGKPDGLIACCELPTLDPTSIYACQDAAWMDERCMLIWVDEVFGAYLVQTRRRRACNPSSSLTRTDAT